MSAIPHPRVPAAPARLDYCARCGSPVYWLVHVPSGEPVTVDWLPTPYGGHVVRQGGACVMDPMPSSNGAYLVVRLRDGTCRHVVAEAAADGRAIYHQDHAETCAVWCGGRMHTDWPEEGA